MLSKPEPKSSLADLDLAIIRKNLVRLEEGIIFALIQRAQFPRHQKAYEHQGVTSNFQNSLFFQFLHEHEEVHARFGRYKFEEEHAFTDISRVQPHFDNGHKNVLPVVVNVNDKLLQTYITKILPLITTERQDTGHYGSSSLADIHLLETLSRRIHMGKFVAESKFLQNSETYSKLIEKNDAEGIYKQLTNTEVENQLLERVKRKVEMYSQTVVEENDSVKEVSGSQLSADLVSKVYREYIIPLTKDVEVLYLLKR